MIAALSGQPRHWPWILVLFLSAALGFRGWAIENYPGEETRPWGLPDALPELFVLGSYYLIPLGLCWLVWAQLRSATRQDAFAQLVVTPLPRDIILRAALHRSRFYSSSLYLALIPLLVLSYSAAWMPVFPLTELFDSWYAGVNHGQCWNWWFTHLGLRDGKLPAAMAAIVGLHCGMRNATAISALCSVRGGGTTRALVLSMLWTLVPLAAGLALAHLIQVGILQLAMDRWADSNGYSLLLRSYFDSRASVPFYHALAALNATIILPSAIVTLFSGAFLRAAARRLDQLVTD